MILKEQEITSKDLIIALGKSIPKYMIPSVLIKKEKLPTNSNGKIDRLILKKEL